MGKVPISHSVEGQVGCQTSEMSGGEVQADRWMLEPCSLCLCVGVKLINS